jgi:hypothetical protein
MYTTKAQEQQQQSSSSLDRSVTPGISKEYAATNGDDEAEPVYVTAMIQLPDRLIVTGYTRGKGLGFSSLSNSTAPTNDAGAAAATAAAAAGANIDGFVTALDLTTLEPLAGASTDGSSSTSTYRISSKGNNFVTGV